MKDKIKNIVVTSVFVLFIAFFAVSCVLKYFNPTSTSSAERRPLAQFPENITAQGIIDKTVIDGFEDYSVDQFPFREFFRSVKAKFQFYALNLKENNGYAVEDGYIAKIESQFNEENVEYSVGRVKFIYDRFIKGKNCNVYTSVIPSKNYFFGEKYGYVTPDYDFMINALAEKLPEATYIDIFSSLELEDYYYADTHWRQEKIGGVVDKLASDMGFADRLSGNYKQNVLEGFKGVHHAQSALYPKSEDLIYLTNDILESCTVYDYETNKTYGIYNLELFGEKDGYDLFLSGSKSLLRIDNPNATTDKELVIFRDSFGSSLAPLLAEGYKSVYVVDTRYLIPQMLPTVIDFENKDVLFIYSTLVLNQRAFK